MVQIESLAPFPPGGAFQLSAIFPLSGEVK